MKSKRLLEIASLVEENSIVADIGTDHGYIPVYLMEEARAKRVIGSDISKGSLNKIVNYVRMKKLEDKIDTRLGNGLEVLRPFEVDTVIIAGMGGMLIRDILEKNWSITNSINSFILQPMIGVKELREYLLSHSYKIEENRLLKEDGKYYEIIRAVRGKELMWDDINLEIPQEFIDEKHPLLAEYIDYKISYARNILDSIAGKDSEKIAGRVRELEEDIENYREVLSKIEG